MVIFYWKPNTHFVKRFRTDHQRKSRLNRKNFISMKNLSRIPENWYFILYQKLLPYLILNMLLSRKRELIHDSINHFQAKHKSVSVLFPFFLTIQGSFSPLNCGFLCRLFTEKNGRFVLPITPNGLQKSFSTVSLKFEQFSKDFLGQVGVYA